jgi:spore maturation protein CgeB
MRFVMFYHSLVSDWNHGNAHFLRGVASELVARGHQVMVHEARDAWSVQHLLADHGQAPLDAFARRYPTLRACPYDRPIDERALDQALDGADVVLVHEWNEPALLRALSQHRRRESFLLLFHDTHHRAVSQPDEMAAFDLQSCDAALVFGEVLRRLYLARRWCPRVHTWHEAADVRVFGPAVPPVTDRDKEADLLWVGNWGDGERSAELGALLVEPVRQLGLCATVHGVGYPPAALTALAAAGIRYRGWLPNFEVPEAMARHRLTIHVPRGPYAGALPGIPTIRVFEALACGVPLVSGPWEDCEGLFRAGRDYLVARTTEEMCEALAWLLANPEEARAMAEHGRQTVLARHTCAHRVDELLTIIAALGGRSGETLSSAAIPPREKAFA